MKNPVIRVDPNWLSFGTSRAVKDIYNYKSPCNKNSIYASLQGGEKHLTNIVDWPKHSHRRRMIAVVYAPKNIEAWESKVVNSVNRLLKQMDDMCIASFSCRESLSKKEDLKFDGVH